MNFSSLLNISGGKRNVIIRGNNCPSLLLATWLVPLACDTFSRAFPLRRKKKCMWCFILDSVVFLEVWNGCFWNVFSVAFSCLMRLKAKNITGMSAFSRACGMDRNVGRWGLFLPWDLGVALAAEACREWVGFAVLNWLYSLVLPKMAHLSLWADLGWHKAAQSM